MTFVSSLPQFSNNPDRFFQHFLTDSRRRPFSTDDMFVQVFSRTDAKEESARHHCGSRGRCMCDDGGMNPDCGTRYACTESNSFCACSDRADDAPDERTLSLLAGPWMKMIRN